MESFLFILKPFIDLKYEISQQKFTTKSWCHSVPLVTATDWILQDDSLRNITFNTTSLKCMYIYSILLHLQIPSLIKNAWLTTKSKFSSHYLFAQFLTPNNHYRNCSTKALRKQRQWQCFLLSPRIYYLLFHYTFLAVKLVSMIYESP